MEPHEFEAMITEWESIKDRLKTLKDRELELRMELCGFLFGMKTGHFKVETNIRTEQKLVAHSKTNIKLDEDKLNKLYEEGALTEAEIACFKPGPISVSEKVRKLNRDLKVWEALTEKPGTPTLEIKPR